MPIIKIYSPTPCPSRELLSQICKQVTEVLHLPADHAWAFWHQVDATSFHKPDWAIPEKNPAPMVMMYCKSTYSNEQVEQVFSVIRHQLSSSCRCMENDIYLSCLRIQPHHLFVRGSIWRE